MSPAMLPMNQYIWMPMTPVNRFLKDNCHMTPSMAMAMAKWQWQSAHATVNAHSSILHITNK